MQIKLRAWDKVNNRMQSWEELLAGKEFKAKLQDPEAHGMVLMMWTGLTDKNGVKIYEGDLVECWSEGQMAIGEVRCRIDGWWFIYPSWKNGMTWGLCPNYRRETTVKILGNIYENPELMEREE